MSQKGTASLIPVLVIAVGLVIGVYFINERTGFLSKALEVIGPSKSATIKIPVRSPEPSKIASSSATPSASSSASPRASASTSASVKPSATASASPR
jgi:hypothetical protein